MTKKTTAKKSAARFTSFVEASERTPFLSTFNEQESDALQLVNRILNPSDKDEAALALAALTFSIQGTEDTSKRLTLAYYCAVQSMFFLSDAREVLNKIAQAFNEKLAVRAKGRKQHRPE